MHECYDGATQHSANINARIQRHRTHGEMAGRKRQEALEARIFARKRFTLAFVNHAQMARVINAAVNAAQRNLEE